MRTLLQTTFQLWVIAVLSVNCQSLLGQDSTDSAPRIYRNILTRIKNPEPLLADYPEFVQPVEEENRYEAPVLVNDPQGELSVRAWRFSYNARGIIEMPNRLSAENTALIMVHPGVSTTDKAGRHRNRLACVISARQ